MSRHLLMTPCLVLGLLLLGIVPAMAATQPTLYTINSGTPKVLGQGVQKSWPIKIDENNAFDAVFKGGMWLPNPAGGQIYAKYQRHIIHPNGTWTWIGSVSTVHGKQSVILTFGKDAVFGLVPQASGYPLRIVTQQGQTSLIATSAQAMASSAKTLGLYSHPDYMIPPRVTPKNKSTAIAASSAANAALQAAASGPVTIDVMVAYTPGFVSELGSQSLALTRIQNLVDMTNTAYTTSGVNQQIRLVNTVEVNYPDNTSNQSALDDITGLDENGNPVTIPASLQGIASLRVQYGADLVTLIRSFDDTTQGNCGTAWLIGGNQTAITQQSNVYGYNVVSDGTSNGYYCLDTTFAHELGHNMGNAHDRADATDPDGTPLSGAYSYSYGYLGTGTGGGFSTIMAYGTTGDSFLNIFSNPNISTCLNSPCGVADSSPNSADNVHSMNNTAALIAAFEPTTVGSTSGPATHNDVNGDGKSDILFFNPTKQQLVYWVMNGSLYVSYRQFNAGAGYTPVGSGDFDGNGFSDILWNGNGTLYAWMNDGAGGFTSYPVTSYPGGWTLVGCGDINGDGREDIVWYHPTLHQLVYWLMNGSTLVSQHAFTVPQGFAPIGVGDFNGDRLADIAWEDASYNVYVWTSNGTTFTQQKVNVVSNSGWPVFGVGDVNGDGDSDIFWFQPSTGHLQYWLMNGATVVGYKLFSTGPGYTLAGIGDFDGDGRADILWSKSNVLSMWLHYDPYNYYGVPVQPYASGWNVLP